jgi:hypothetical protein
MFTEEMCTNCKTPHPAGRYACECGATFSAMGLHSSYNVVDDEKQVVVEVTRRWAFCPLCGAPTGLKGSTSKRVVLSLKDPLAEGRK